MKKRVLALALAAVMSLGTVASVAAEEQNVDKVTGSANGSVTAEVTKLVLPTEKTYLVTVKIPEMAFEYSFGNAGKWNTETLQYEAPEDAGWKGATTADIEVTNKSDADVALKCVYEDASKVSGVDGKISCEGAETGEKTLASAVNEENPLEAGEATKTTFTLTISGTPDKEIEAGTVIGNVTLTVNAA